MVGSHKIPVLPQMLITVSMHGRGMLMDDDGVFIATGENRS